LKAESSSYEAETVSLLQQLIRFKSVNPPGNELPVARHIDELFKAEGIDSRLIVQADNRGAVVARIRGNGSKRPVMLLAHMDVVGVEADKWSCDPFEGVVRDGYLYGRGAIDDKGMLAANVMTMRRLQREVVSAGSQLSRDVVFVATSDEEAGGSAGIKWLIENHRDLFDAEFAVNEGGRVRIIAGDKRYAAIQTAEKVSHLVKLTARGPAGHASVPREANAIFHLGRVLERLSNYSEPVTLTSTTKSLFGGLAQIWPDESLRAAMSAIASSDGETNAGAAAILSSVPVFNAVMRNTISPTGLTGGTSGNVIPAEVSVSMNVRTIPGHSIDDLVQRLRDVVADDEIEIEVSARGAEGPPSDESSEMFDALAGAAKALDPEITVVPYLSTGATDSSALRRIGINSYGILPFPMGEIDEGRMHGHDERVPIESLHVGTRLIYEAVRRVGGRKTDFLIDRLTDC
jgi:acetylornithine deacetylase/succinyl-diaminopimelate desuccinylase-like protein